MDSEYGSARFTSTDKSLMSVFEQDTMLVWIARRDICVDFSVGWLARILNLNQNGKYKTSILSTWGRFLLTGKGCKPQVGNSYIEILWNASPQYFFLLNWSEFGKIFVCKRSHEFVISPDSKKFKLASILEMHAISLPPFSAFGEPGYLQNAGADFLGHGSLSYHFYLFLDEIPVHDSIIYGFNWVLQIEGPVEQS